MNTAKPTASLSLDLDDLWTYLKTHGDPGWETFPSYLDRLVPRVLSVLRERGLTVTVFVVGADAARRSNRDALRALAAAGHEIGNHSFRHEPWMHRYPAGEVRDEIAGAEESIAEATGRRPAGFRGPGFSLSGAVLDTLVRRGYRYDASTFPTWVMPLARAYYFLRAPLTAEEREERRDLGGTWAAALRPVRPYLWDTPAGRLPEVPVTTLPLFKVPMHFSYLFCLASRSPALALGYLDAALGLCRWTGTEPSLLLHPTDFLGGDEVPALGYFPGMNLSGKQKVELLGEMLGRLAARFAVRTVGQHAEAVARRPHPHLRRPDFAPAAPGVPSALRRAA
jgi:peptidoglycan/xylan/chitin deacetylase (PgdA/CDA1 family)